MLGSCAPHQDFCAQLCHSGDGFTTTYAMHSPQGPKRGYQVTQEVHLLSWSSAQAQPQALSTSTLVTQPHRSAPLFPGTLFSPVSHLQCHNLSLSPCIKLSGTSRTRLWHFPVPIQLPRGQALPNTPRALCPQCWAWTCFKFQLCDSFCAESQTLFSTSSPLSSAMICILGCFFCVPSLF